MASPWLGLALCLGVLVANVHLAAVPTQDTIVVARSEDESGVSSATEAEVTTEEPNAPIKMTEMRVRSEVALRYARTQVETRVRNPARRPQEATFHVLLPDTAFISGFVMTLDGKSYKAYIKEKEEAKQIYSTAVSQGLGAAHIAAKARDSNHFTVTVNVEPNSLAIFNLTYEELLVRRNGVYNHAINLHPGALVPKMEVVVHIKETQKITQLRVPEVRTGNEIDATEDDKQNSNAVIQKEKGGKEATITFTPDIAEQKRLVDVYIEKTKTPSKSDQFYANDDEEEKQNGVLGQFVVQYDVDRSNTGEILVNDGYFVHFLAPSSLPPLKKHAVFVLDTSGSMMGHKIEQLHEAMHTILSSLNHGDYFSIVEFDSTVKVHELKEADEPEPKRSYSYFDRNPEPTTLAPPSLATPENISKAKTIVTRLFASGGTNIYGALDVAIDLVKKGVNWNTNVTSTTALPEPAQEKAVAAADNAVKNVDDDLEPIIIFLTDGDPTVGETNPTRIISHITEKNSGQKRASIFSLAFGDDADRSFLRKLSLRNEGFMRHIYAAADAALQLRDFYRQVASPLLANVKFLYPKEQIKESSVTRNKFRALYLGGELVVAGELQEGATEIAPEVHAFCGVEDGLGRKRFEVKPKAAAERNRHLPLERLWAFLTVKQLLDERDAADQRQDDDESPEKKALAIALKYEFVTPLTSLVVVKPNTTDAVNAEPVNGQGSVPSYNVNLSPQAPSFGAFAGYSSNMASARRDTVMNRVWPSYRLRPAPAAASLDLGHHLLSGHAHPLLLDTAPMFSSASKFDVQEEDDYDMPEASYLSTPLVYRPPTAVSTTAAPRPTTAVPRATTTAVSLDTQYHLEDFKWALGLLNDSADALIFWENDTRIILKLSKDVEPPKANDGDKPCSNVVGAASNSTMTLPAASSCVYLTRCKAAADITIDQYRTTYCFVNDRYAGVCCPNSEVDEKRQH